MNDLLSILLISYNVKEYITQCIESVVNQTYTDLEIICVDAQSTDGTLEILQKYARNDSRIKIIPSEKKSYGFQVNLGIANAKGEYIQIVETDDYLPKEACFELMNAAIKYDVDVVKGNYEKIREYCNGYVKKEIVDCLFWKKDIKQVVINTLDYPLFFVMDSGIWRGIYRRSFLLENNIVLNETPGAAFQDIGFIIRVLIAAKRIVNIESPVYCYREMRPGASTTNSNSLEYCQVEYKRLLEEVQGQNGLNEIYTNGIYLRLIGSLILEVKKMCVYNLEINEESFNWFCEIINNALDQKIVSAYENPFIDWDALRSIMKGTEESRKYYGKISASIALDTTQEYTVFGNGKRGKYVVEYLLTHGIIPTAIIDNASVGNPMDYCNIPIYEPEYWVKRNPKSLYVISSSIYADEMKNQLLSLGVNEKRIVVF